MLSQSLCNTCERLEQAYDQAGHANRERTHPSVLLNWSLNLDASSQQNEASTARALGTTMTDRIEAMGKDEVNAQLSGIINGAALTLCLSIGHRTGLLETMAHLPPSRSDEIAAAAGLQERYVREWLNAMTMGRLITFEPCSSTYLLPADVAAAVTAAAGPRNYSFTAQYLSILGAVEDDIVEHFKSGGGVAYDRYPTYQAIRAEKSAAFFDSSLISDVLPLVPGLTDRLRAGVVVADVGCGHGHAICVLAKAFPNSSFIGLDLSTDVIAKARETATQLGLHNASFEAVDIATMRGAFDVVMAFDVIHDLAQPRVVLEAIRASLRPDGVFLCADFAGSSSVEDNVALPLAPWFYTVSLMLCMTVSLADGGEGLGNMWGEQRAVEYLSRAGFTVAEPVHLAADPQGVYYVCRPSA